MRSLSNCTTVVACGCTLPTQLNSALLAVALVLGGCSDNNNDRNANTSAGLAPQNTAAPTTPAAPPVLTAPEIPQSAQTTVQGVVAAGLATCSLALTSADGTRLTTSDHASSTSGDFVILFGDQTGTQTGAMILADSNCSYEDEHSGAAITGATLRAGFAVTAEDIGTTITVNVSPYPNLLYARPWPPTACLLQLQ